MKVQVALVQSRCTWDKDENLAKAVGQIREAAAGGANIVCLQEFFLTPYFMQTEDVKLFKLAEEVPGPTTEVLSKVAAEENCVIIASLFEKRGQGVYHNTAAIIDADGSYLGKYRKMHIPEDPFFHEKFYFTPGDLGYRTWKTRFGKIGVLICWDQWYPEAARLTAMSGAQMLFYPTAIAWIPREKAQYGVAQHTAWETVQRGHAVANGCYVFAPNRTGMEDNLEFWGQSFAADPYGQIMKRASIDQEEILQVECDLSVIDDIRCNWPFFRDRRIETYGDLQKRFLLD
ncbi:MAG TPA: carbon-nitrogen hydrolase [Opitutales bacterium]|nr:carbon-nitrogen hydrolase [Opitutales bacterium]